MIIFFPVANGVANVADVAESELQRNIELVSTLEADHTGVVNGHGGREDPVPAGA